MVIYKCDKCKKVTDKSDLLRIRATSELYDDNKWAQCWVPHIKTAYFDVCKECEENIMAWFIGQLMEGADNETSS